MPFSLHHRAPGACCNSSLRPHIAQRHARCASLPKDLPELGDIPEWDPNPSSQKVAQMDAEDLALMMKDLEEYGKAVPPPSPQSSSPESEGGGGGWKDAIDKVLIADFFFVVVILLWLLAGLAERAAGDSSVLLDAWYPLWPTLFQPALGVLMLGALASGVAGKMNGGKE